MSLIVQYKAVIIASWFVAIFLLERLAAAATNASGLPHHRLARNFALFFLVSLASPLVILPIVAWADGVALWERPLWASNLVVLLFDILILDLFTYVLHRAYHVVPVMWRLHEPHHLDEHLDASSALRFHVGEVVLSALCRVPLIILLAVPFSHVVVFETLLLTGAIFHHSNLRLPQSFENMLSKLIVTPSIHWVHHHAVRADTDSNYGAIFSFWDPLFASRSPTKRHKGMKIGVEGIEEKSLLGLLLSPLVKRK